MQLMAKMDNIGFSPNFSCYSNDSLTSMAAAKVSCEAIEEEHAAEFQEFSDCDEDGFEFSFDFSGEEYSPNELSLAGRIPFPIFNRDLTTMDEVVQVDREIKEVVHDDPSVIISVENLFLDHSDDTPSSSSSGAEELEDRNSRTFCVSWRKADGGLPALGDCKKSKSTGSGSKGWRIKDIFGWSNSAGKDMILFLCPKKIDAPKQKRRINSGEVRKVPGKSKTTSSQSVHELFYVQKKAEQKGEKMKSYLPYKKDLLGFFVNVNGIGNKKLPF